MPDQQWSTLRTQTGVYIRKGAGNAWQLFSLQGEMAATSGGGRSVESRWGRKDGGGEEPKGSILTSNQERWEGDLMRRLNIQQIEFLQKLEKCPFDVKVLQLCGDYRDRTNYLAAIGYLDGYTTSKTYSTALANNADTPGDDTMETFSGSWIDEFRQEKLAHLDITNADQDVAINKVISVGLARCDGDCGVEKSGEEEFWFVTDQDATPGYLTVPAARFGYTLDSGATRTFGYIEPFQHADALDVAKLGDYVLVASPQGGVARANFNDILNGVLLPWTRTLVGGTNGPRAIAVTPGGIVWAAGNNGYIYKSVDGGLTWTTFSAGSVTTQQINDIVAVADDNVWFAANGGVLLRYNGRVAARVTISGVSANLNCVAVPRGRSKEVYVGTANGLIYRSRNTNATTPTFALVSVDMSGSGSIDDIEFAGYLGNIMAVLQSNAAGRSRVLRDLSGGNGALDIEIIGSFDLPNNTNINSIAMANENFGLTAGELVDGFGFIGQLAAL